MEQLILENKSVEGYSLRQIIGAIRDIVNKIRNIEYKLISLTGFVIRDGEIRLNYRKDKINNKDIYDSYKIDLDGNIVSLSNTTIDEHNKSIIEEYKYLLQLYFKMYHEFDKKYVYSVKDSNFKIYFDSKCVVLYKDTKKCSVSEINPFDIDFYCLFNNDELKINNNEIDVDELLEVKVVDDLPKLIINSIQPISILETNNKNIYKITNYSSIKEKIVKILKKRLYN